jgi:hypothetical protein
MASVRASRPGHMAQQSPDRQGEFRRVLKPHRPSPEISISLAASFGPLPSSSCFMNT